MPLPSIRDSYGKAIQAIITPMKLEYSIDDLGPVQFTVNEGIIKRSDFALNNKYGNSIACSFFENISSPTPLPVVIYCHANGSCRLEALQYKQLILSQNVHYFCFDFTACGKSGGKYGSIGIYEQDDLERVIQYLKESKKTTKIALWGRSMGAVTSIMYSTRDPSITCIIVDSPFANFKRLVKELVKNRSPVPGFVTSVALSMIRRSVKKKAKFDVYALAPIKHIEKLRIPALFGAPKDDSFVSPQHTKDLYMKHNGHKKLATFEGDHNSQRPFEWIKCVLDFLKVQLLDKKNEQIGMPSNLMGPKIAMPQPPTKAFEDFMVAKKREVEIIPLKKNGEMLPGKVV